MSNFIHSLHNFIVIIVRYLIIIAVVGFMPVPLFSFLGGDTLAQIDHNPLFDYFNHYPLNTDSVIEHVFTNIYIAEENEQVNEWDVDNAVLWADALAYNLQEQGVPVVRHFIINKKQHDFGSVKAIYSDAYENSFLPIETQNFLLELKAKFQSFLPLGPVTEDARQWIILAFSANQKSIKKELKSLVSDYPNDNFLVLTKNPVNLNKKTLQIALPKFNTKQAKKALSEGLKITQAQAQILLVENQRSLWSLNQQKGEAQEISFRSLLGENYVVLRDLSEKEQTILSELCKEGNLKVSGKKVDLSEYGVIIKNKKYQWENGNARINYQLQKQTLCGKAWIDVEEIAAAEGHVTTRNQETKETEHQSQASNQDKETPSRQQEQHIQQAVNQEAAENTDTTDKKSKPKEKKAKSSKRQSSKQESNPNQIKENSDNENHESSQSLNDVQHESDEKQIPLD